MPITIKPADTSEALQAFVSDFDNQLEYPMNLIELFENHRTEILAEAIEALEQARLKHYQASSVEDNNERLGDLLNLVEESIQTHNLIPVITYAQEIARERFAGGFDIAEVLTAFNVLEEAIWHQITANLVAEEYPDAFGLSSTVFGAAKQALATEYVSLASHGRVQTADLSSLFQGNY